ncbi:MAG: amino acid permease [Cytophagales bacterium]
MDIKTLFAKKSIENINREAEVHGSQLNKTLSVFDLTFFGIAAIVGAGIFSTIGQAVVHGGPAVSLLFLFTAFSCGLSALCYAQFASSVPVAGSAYTYAYVSFGELIAWIVGWDLFMEYAISNIAVAISWSDYFSSMMRGFGIDIVKNFQLGGSNYKIDWPASVVTIFITYLCYIGIKESRNINNWLVALKLLVIFMVLAIGAFYVQPANWVPFAPNGVSGVLFGISSVFFAYIGFDAISTTAEECRDPQREMPKAMIWALLISTIIYIAITLVLTGMVPYFELGVGDPLAFVFQKYNLHFLSGIISFSSVITLSTVMLVYQLGQPRIWMAMSRDGLLPKIFSTIHPKFKTPSFATVVMGLTVGIPALFANLKDVVDLTSIGTLFAFALVCGGIIVQDVQHKSVQAKFKVPYINSRYFLPLILLPICIYSYTQMGSLFVLSTDRLLLHIFLAITLIISVLAMYFKWSLIPVFGLLTNLYLMTELGITNWVRFLIWLALGLAVYFLYGYKKSKLRENNSAKI